MNKNFGILYVATGKRFIEEVCRSAASAKNIMPDIPIAIFVDDKSLLPLNLFDYVGVIDNPTHSPLDKILPLTKTPFKKTLFLDSDTLVIEPFYGLPELLEKFDLACSHTPRRFVPRYDTAECPRAFPELNTGVILYSKVDPVLNLFKAWFKIYEQQLSMPPKPPDDQPAFRKAIYESSVNFTILIPEYNLRTICPYFAGGNTKVKILHGRNPSLNEVKSTINKDLSIRVGDPNRDTIKIKKLKKLIKKAMRKVRRLTTHSG